MHDKERGEFVSSSGAVGQIDGWNVAKQGALLTLGRARGIPITAADATALGQRLPTWARDPEVYAVVLDASLLALERGDVEDGAAAAIADLIWRLDGFSKPTVSLMAGVTGEIGMALALAGTHRAVSDGFKFALTSLAAARLPPGNVLATLAQCRPRAAVAPLLAGRTIGAADAFHLGLAGHVIDPTMGAAILSALADADPVDPLLDDRHGAPAPLVVAADITPPAALQALLSDLETLPLDAAILQVHQRDQARTPGSDQTRLTLPSRRALQAFRKG